MDKISIPKYLISIGLDKAKTTKFIQSLQDNTTIIGLRNTITTSTTLVRFSDKQLIDFARILESKGLYISEFIEAKLELLPTTMWPQKVCLLARFPKLLAIIKTVEFPNIKRVALKYAKLTETKLSLVLGTVELKIQMEIIRTKLSQIGGRSKEGKPYFVWEHELPIIKATGMNTVQKTLSYFGTLTTNLRDIVDNIEIEIIENNDGRDGCCFIDLGLSYELGFDEGQMIRASKETGEVITMAKGTVWRKNIGRKVIQLDIKMCKLGKEFFTSGKYTIGVAYIYDNKGKRMLGGYELAQQLSPVPEVINLMVESYKKEQDKIIDAFKTRRGTIDYLGGLEFGKNDELKTSAWRLLEMLKSNFPKTSEVVKELNELGRKFLYRLKLGGGIMLEQKMMNGSNRLSKTNKGKFLAVRNPITDDGCVQIINNIDYFNETTTKLIHGDHDGDKVGTSKVETLVNIFEKHKLVMPAKEPDHLSDKLENLTMKNANKASWKMYVGNGIGELTVLQMNLIALGYIKEAGQISTEIQACIDGLKHNVKHINIDEIRKLVKNPFSIKDFQVGVDFENPIGTLQIAWNATNKVERKLEVAEEITTFDLGFTETTYDETANYIINEWNNTWKTPGEKSKEIISDTCKYFKGLGECCTVNELKALWMKCIALKKVKCAIHTTGTRFVEVFGLHPEIKEYIEKLED